jgi:hypothetical protein
MTQKLAEAETLKHKVDELTLQIQAKDQELRVAGHATREMQLQNGLLSQRLALAEAKVRSLFAWIPPAGACG